MTRRYALSGRQRKEVVQRSTELLLALPLDWETSGDDDADPLEFARASLALPRDVQVVAAQFAEAPVAPSRGGGDGLTGVLGAILREDQALRAWHCVIAVCLATVQAGARPEHRNPRPQWPAAREEADEDREGRDARDA